MSLIPPPNEAGDIFSLSDQQLSERYQFVEEIGFGNWGSVWLCRPKDADGHPIDDAVSAARCTGKVAVKLVHRSKTPTTAARVRSLWNEMKVVRSFKNDPHPSIIPFHNFIITPSYALITMAYLPSLVPVEVPELRAKPWFLSLISAVAFLHARGVVHNDIKPANILLTASNSPVPVLVDFGFAEKYDPRSSKAFLSNLAYGTPEYLSPERARGLPHDTRKSDVWSLGVTLFEILRGRTPFEYAEPDGTTETFSTKADLEKYWGRTVKGKWVGKWSMSKGLERLLRKMILPNADLRITAPVALNDSYFDPDKPDTPGKDRSRSTLSLRSPSEVDASRLIEVTPPWADRSGAPTGFSPPASLLKSVAAAATRRANVTSNKENVSDGANTHVPSGKENANLHTRRENIHSHQRTQSAKSVLPHSKLPTIVQPPKHVTRQAPSLNADINGSTSLSTSPTSRRPAKTLNVNPTPRYNASIAADTSNRTSVLTASSFASKENSVANSRTSAGRRVPVRKPMPAIFAAAHKGKQANNNMHEDTRQSKENRKSRVLVDLTKVKTNGTPITEANVTTPVSEGRVNVGGLLTPVAEDPPRLFVSDTFPRSTKESTSISVLKQGIKQSLDKGVRLYKSSALGSYGNLLGNKSTSGLSSVPPELCRSVEGDSERPSEDTKESWENDVADRIAKSSLPTVRHAIRNEQVAADNRLDRMTIWIRNVERVVEDARANFAAGSMTPLPPLPPRTAQANRRAAPKITEIFEESNATGDNGLDSTHPVRQRRVTLVSQSPEAPKEDSNKSSDDLSPVQGTTRKAKAQSVFDIARPITPLATLELELAKSEAHSPLRSPTRLSAVLDPNTFFAPFAPPMPVEDESSAPEISYTATERVRGVLTTSSNELSPVRGADYDEILISSLGVKRLGKGYESHIKSSNIVEQHPASVFKRNPKLFHSARRGVAPPPETPRKAVSVDELGALGAAQESAARKDDGNHTIKLMRRAFKAITGGTVSRRLSKAV